MMVLLPHPLLPTSATTFPAGIDKENSWRIKFSGRDGFACPVLHEWVIWKWEILLKIIMKSCEVFYFWVLPVLVLNLQNRDGREDYAISYIAPNRMLITAAMIFPPLARFAVTTIAPIYMMTAHEQKASWKLSDCSKFSHKCKHGFDLGYRLSCITCIARGFRDPSGIYHTHRWGTSLKSCNLQTKRWSSVSEDTCICHKGTYYSSRKCRNGHVPDIRNDLKKEDRRYPPSWLNDACSNLECMQTRTWNDTRNVTLYFSHMVAIHTFLSALTMPSVSPMLLPYALRALPSSR